MDLAIRFLLGVEDCGWVVLGAAPRSRDIRYA